MTTDLLPAPVAPRLRRPSWRDPRLVVGVVLVALAVALGSWAVSTASRTVPVWAAAGPLTPGTELTAGDLRVTEVRLGEQTERYLPASEPLPEGLVLTRVVGEGELVARSALADAGSLDLRSVAVPVERALTEKVGKGAIVDIWFVPDAGPGGQGAEGPTEPFPVVENVVVEQRDDASSGIVIGSGATLHVLVPTADLPALLGALGDDGTVDIVPVAGAVH